MGWKHKSDIDACTETVEEHVSGECGGEERCNQVGFTRTL